MCGIFAYTGDGSCVDLLLKGLRRLEYRGYDSAGLAVQHDGSLVVRKAVGRVDALAEEVSGVVGSTGVAHTRWATHGAPTVRNAHPHVSSDGRVAIVHNGIIENHASLRAWLENKGFSFSSETDSEVLAHLVAHERSSARDFPEAVSLALRHVEGAFGLVVIDRDVPGTLVAARRGSPLVLGLSEGATFVSSDPSALVEHTRKAVYLKDDELALLTPGHHEVRSLSDGVRLDPSVDTIDWDISELEKGGYPHFMLKEIHEQPDALARTLKGRLKKLRGQGVLRSLNLPDAKAVACRRVVIVGCGTSWHAGLVAKHYFERLAGVCVEVAYASEFRYDDTPLREGDLVVAVSQSGETADTLEALRKCKGVGAFTLGVVNVVGSTIAREVDGGLFLHAGPEIGVASTKAFTTQLVALLLVALHVGHRKGLVDKAALGVYEEGFDRLFPAVEKALGTYDSIRSFAPRFKDSSNALYLGRGSHFPVALEGALKLKEISYIHAEGLPAAEMKHGPIALIDKDMPVVVLAPKNGLYNKVLSNIQEVRARGGRLVVVSTHDDPQLSSLAEEVVRIPDVLDDLQPVVSVIPLQLLAYELAKLRGCDIDKPRNLAKSCTVE
ncbi:glutamine--fructose-6-phosphate transaminase (isomerizing) [Candidatus Woesearchaeota archaeon]|nr:glutamine--fructose-6-phosphate transaminase (isomerizing) [Candidatus Woesearchaeota archaeon]